MEPLMTPKTPMTVITWSITCSNSESHQLQQRHNKQGVPSLTMPSMTSKTLMTLITRSIICPNSEWQETHNKQEVSGFVIYSMTPMTLMTVMTWSIICKSSEWSLMETLMTPNIPMTVVTWSMSVVKIIYDIKYSRHTTHRGSLVSLYTQWL